MLDSNHGVHPHGYRLWLLHLIKQLSYLVSKAKSAGWDPRNLKNIRLLEHPCEVKEPNVMDQTTNDIDILDDSYRWRKYGYKVVSEEVKRALTIYGHGQIATRWEGRGRARSSYSRGFVHLFIVTKDGGQEKNDVECSQDKPSIGDLEAKTNKTITNDENATEKEASDKTG
nr:WRKY transcription factor 7 [Tanacetum cinerariifolium]